MYKFKVWTEMQIKKEIQYKLSETVVLNLWVIPHCWGMAELPSGE